MWTETIMDGAIAAAANESGGGKGGRPDGPAPGVSVHYGWPSSWRGPWPCSFSSDPKAMRRWMYQLPYLRRRL